ncbi:MAG: hypothetical protein KJ622_07200 [Alphaproteobacteria bacterium]|nr:hypothetical protein [Alphaproteobacteria bacterium]
MSENVIWLNRPSGAGAHARRKDRNVAVVEAAFQFIVSHPFTDGDASEARPGMTREDALLLADVIALALRIAMLGPAEFEAWASKDMAYFEHWLRHYEKQIARFLAE